MSDLFRDLLLIGFFVMWVMIAVHIMSELYYRRKWLTRIWILLFVSIFTFNTLLVIAIFYSKPIP